MVSLNDKKWVDAVYKENWICVTIFAHNIEHMLIHCVSQFVRGILEQKIASKFQYKTIDQNGGYLQLIFKTSPANNDLYLKPKLLDCFSKYFGKEILPRIENLPVNVSDVELFNMCIDYNDCYIHDMTYVVDSKSATIISDILSKASKIILDLMVETGERNWNEESAIKKAIPIHLGFAHAFGMNLNELAGFYYFYFNKNLSAIQNLQGVEDLEDWKSKFVLGIDNNFQQQKDVFSDYCEYLLNSFEEEAWFEEDWINEWLNFCSHASKILLDLKENGTYRTFNKIITDDSLNIDANIQEKWPIFEIILKTINNELGINFLMEFNLIYSIRESIVSLIERKK